MADHKIAVMEGVREYTEREPVELWFNEVGRLVIRSYNECGNNRTDVDLADLLDWVSVGSKEGEMEYARGLASLSASERN